MPKDTKKLTLNQETLKWLTSNLDSDQQRSGSEQCGSKIECSIVIRICYPGVRG